METNCTKWGAHPPDIRKPNLCREGGKLVTAIPGSFQRTHIRN
eukprot:UN14926